MFFFLFFLLIIITTFFFECFHRDLFDIGDGGHVLFITFFKLNKRNRCGFLCSFWCWF